MACANDRCDQENVIEQLKNGVNALRVPLYDLVSNWAYMVIAALAWNLKSWFAMMLHRKADRRDWITMEFRRFTAQVILIPAMVIRRARSITVADHRLPPRPGPIPQRRQHHRTHPLRLTPPRPLHFPLPLHATPLDHIVAACRAEPLHTRRSRMPTHPNNPPIPAIQPLRGRSPAPTTVQHPETGPAPSRSDLANNPETARNGSPRRLAYLRASSTLLARRVGSSFAPILESLQWWTQRNWSVSVRSWILLWVRYSRRSSAVISGRRRDCTRAG